MNREDMEKVDMNREDMEMLDAWDRQQKEGLIRYMVNGNTDEHEVMRRFKSMRRQAKKRLGIRGKRKSKYRKINEYLKGRMREDGYKI